ncbi:MAG: ketopantoate reductase family protein [Armatimonadota bacterium]
MTDNSTLNTQHSKLHFAVIGPGALGTLFAARLALAGMPVLLLDYRPERAAALNARPLRLLDASGEHEVPVPVTADARRLQEVDAALILVKAYQTETVAAALAKYLSPDAVAVSLQNGLGNVEALSAHLGSARVIGGMTSQGALLEGPGVARDTGTGPTVIGRPDGSEDEVVKRIGDALLQARLAASVTRDLPAALWSKLLLNVAINPVAALTRLRNGALAEHEPSLTLMTAAAREAETIGRKHGVRLPRQDWRARLQVACAATAPNVNSMLADVLHARRTEIDALNGAVIRIAEQHGMAATVNRTLMCLIKTIEEGYEGQVARG